MATREPDDPSGDEQARPRHTLASLEREGRYSPPVASPPPWPEHPGGPQYTAEQVDALLDELKGDH